MIGWQTSNAWAWTMQSVFSDFLTKMNLHPYKIVGFPQIDTEKRHDKDAITVTITFDMVPDPMGDSQRRP